MRNIKRFFSAMAIVLLSVAVMDAPVLAGSHVAITEQPPAAISNIYYTTPTGGHDFTPTKGARLTVVHLWATWCVPCTQELPELDKALAENKARGLEVLPLAGETDVQKVQQFYSSHGVTQLPVALDPGLQAIYTLGIRALPTSLFVDAKGQVVARADGPVDWASPATQEFLNKALAM